MKVFISKYALTTGIFDVYDAEQSGDRMICFKSCAGYLQYVHKPHWHETKQEAIEKAENMRLKKIASLKKQIEKLEKMRFE